MARTALQNARVEPGVAGATSWDIRDLLTANESKSGASRVIPSKHLILRHLMVRIRRAFGAACKFSRARLEGIFGWGDRVCLPAKSRAGLATRAARSQSKMRSSGHLWPITLCGRQAG